MTCQGRVLPDGARCDRAAMFAVLRTDHGAERNVCDLHLAEAVRDARRANPNSYVTVGTPEPIMNTMSV